MTNPGEAQARINFQTGLDPMVALEERRKLSNRVAKLREELAPYRAKYRGGTASPYDQERKVKVSQIARRIRDQMVTETGKASETKVDSLAHSDEEYLTWLQTERLHFTEMYRREGQLYGLEQDIAEWDKLIDMARTMTHYVAGEMRMA